MRFNIKKITIKKYFCFLIAVFIIAIGLMIFSPIFIHPRVQNFSDYKPLSSWDISQYAIGNFDSDGKEDIVTATGCVFLSSVSEENISDDKKCISSQSQFVSKDFLNKVGQKYFDFPEKQVDKDYPASAMGYAYMGKTQEGKWRIYAQRNKKTILSEINNGQIRRIEELPLATKIDEFLYYLSFLTFLGYFTAYYISRYVFPASIFISIVVYALKRFVFKPKSSAKAK